MRWIILALCFGGIFAVDWDVETALDTYVQSDDGFFSWEILATYRYNNTCTLHVVNMTSQKWMDETFVDRPYWWHYMSIAVPDPANLTYPDASFIIINGGSNNNSPPDENDAENLGICIAAMDTGTVGAIISQIPNQPLYFANDPTNEQRTEDEIIAWTWRTFIDDPNPDPTVIARFPFTKAVKRGMDTINQVAAANHAHTPNVSRFAPIGASKRGWTTWSITATDRRVVAMIPLVFSMLKMNETLMVHYRAMGGGWSFAFEPYWVEGLTRELLTDKAQQAFAYEDMWHYRERYTLPFVQMVSTGDEFFLLQDSHQWWDDMPDPKWTTMFENAEHTMFPHYLKIYQTATAFFISVLEGRVLPTVSWDRGETADGGYIDYYYDIEPEEITVFRAVTLQNDTARDFRLANLDSDTGEVAFHPVLWTEFNSTLELVAPGHYRATVDKVDGEWVGFVVRGMWRGPDGKRMFYTSETQVVPDTFSVPPCTDADECYGRLV